MDALGVFLHEPVVHEETNHDPAAARRKGHLEQHGVRGREPQLERRSRRRVRQGGAFDGRQVEARVRHRISA